MTTRRLVPRIATVGYVNYKLNLDVSMETINIHEAKTHLSRLVEQAAKGEPFIIAKAGKPLVKVVPLQGSLHGKQY